MADPIFRPKILVLEGCPFCTKALVFLGEAGLLDQFDLVRLKQGSDELAAARELLGRHLEKVGFPTVEVAPGEYLADSDAIIEKYGDAAKVDRSTLRAFDFYVSTLMPNVNRLYKENMELKKAQRDA